MQNTNHLSIATSTSFIANNNNNITIPSSTAPLSGNGNIANQTRQAYYYSGSITPTTQGEAKPINLALLVANLSSAVNDVTIGSSSEQPTEANNSVPLSTPFANSSPANEPILLKIPYQKDVDTANATGPLVQRFSIDPYTTKAEIGSEIRANEMHPLEIKAFTEALQELAKHPSAETYSQGPKDKYAYNITIVDIFVTKEGKVQEYFKDRSNGNPNGTATGTPETHATVLWKKKDNEIVLFDPNDRKFSERIQSPLQGLTSSQLVSLATIPGTGTAVYGSKDSRDCIDVAVKIAFEIDEQQKKGTDITQIEKNTLEQITNLRKVNTDPALTNKLLQARARQSSDAKTREDANQPPTNNATATQSKSVRQKAQKQTQSTSAANNNNSLSQASSSNTNQANSSTEKKEKDDANI